MRSLSYRLFFVLAAVVLAPALLAHDVTITGTQTFASLDGSAGDHDGSANGVFTVNDGNLTVNGVVNCNDDGGGANSACAMAFVVSGNLTINAGGALYAENRQGAGSGGAITLTVGGNLALSGNAIVSSASTSNAGGSNGGAINATVSGGISVGAGSTIDSGTPGGTAGSIALAAGGVVTIDGNVLAGPSRSVAATRLTGAALTGGTGNQNGGQISVTSTTSGGPAVVVGATGNVVSQGQNATGAVKLDGCGVDVRGLVVSLSRDSSAVVTLRSGKSVTVDGRDLAGAGLRMGRVRADSLTGTAAANRVDLFASDSVSVLGSAAGVYAVSSNTGSSDPKGEGGSVRAIAIGGNVTASGNAVDAGGANAGNGGGSIALHSAGDAVLNGANLRAAGDHASNNNNRDGGVITVRSYAGNVFWINGTGDVRPLGSASSIPLADQGSITLTACGTVDTTGSSFPVNGTATSVHPQTQTGVCSPAAPSLPAGTPALIVCNTPPVADDTAATTNEDTTVTITLSGTDADGDSLTFTIVSGPSNGVLGAVISTGPTTATVDYTPNADYFGADSFVFQANDGNGGTDNGNASITVNAVNDPPSFLAGPTVTVDEDAGPQSYANWATGISAGPANESGQTVTFTVTNDNPSLFTAGGQPALSSSGTLTFTAAANAFGSANITVVAQDDGGTANGGDDTSNPQTSSISVTAVNDAPSFTKGADQTVNEDAGPQTVAGWATGISAGPNEGSQTVSFVVTNDDNALFAAGGQPAVSASGTLTYTPAANANGTATVTLFAQDDGGTANGGVDSSATQTFTITVGAVNDAPSFTAGGNVTVLEDSAPYSATWATAVSAGPADESGQTLTFNVTATTPSLFASGPSISSSGVLTFTLNANVSGSSSVTATLSDDGGTANGGADTSAAANFTITVDPVNDAPSFTAGGDVTVNEDSGPYAAGWATAISAGPNESGQTVAFNVSNNNNALFAGQPSISPTGVLTFTPAANAFGTATVTVSLSDNGGTANGGVDTSAAVTFTITVTAVNDAPVAGNDSWDTFGNTELRVDVGTALTPHVLDTTPSGTGVRDNDTDAEGDGSMVSGIVGCGDAVAPYDCTLAGGAKVSMQANGAFSYTPGPGATSGSFQYTVTDTPAFGAPATATGTVTINIFDMIWYVNGTAAPGGNGTSNAPFNDFASLNGTSDVDAPGHTIFVHTSPVVGSISLEAAQKLWGQGIGLSKPNNLNGNGSPVVLAPAGAHPVVTASADVVSIFGVTGVEVAGLSLNSATGSGIEVTSTPLGAPFSATIYSNLITGAGAEGIDVNAGSPSGNAVSIDNTSIISTGTGLSVTAAGVASVSYTNGSITSLSGSGIAMDGSTGTLTVTGLGNVTIDGNTAGDGINITAATFDAVAGGSFNAVNAGAIAIGTAPNPVGGRALVLGGTSGDLVFGGLTAYAGTGNAVGVTGSGLFTGAAGMRVSGGGATSAASTPSGAAVSVVNASIGATHLTFATVNGGNAVNGIVLNNTGTAGGLKVVGTGTAGTGGTIANTSGAGVLAIDTAHLGLAQMTIQNPGASGIDAQNLGGNSSLTGTTVTQFNAASTDGFRLVNDNTNLASLTISGSTFSNSATGNDGLSIEARGTSSMSVTVDQNSLFTGLFGDGIDARTLTGASGTVTVNVRNSTFSNAAPLGNGGISLNPFGGPLTFNFDVDSNVFTNIMRPVTNLGAVNMTTGDVDGAGPTVNGTIRNNDLNVIVGARGISAIADTFAGPLTLLIDNNQIDRLGSTSKHAISVTTNNDVAGAKVRIVNNDIGQEANLWTAGNGSGSGILVQSAGASSMGLLVDGNAVTANTIVETVRVRAINASSLNATVTNNTITDTAGTHVEINANTATATGTGPTLCFNVSGNTVPAGGVGVIQLNENAGALNVVQASAAAVAAANNGATVTQVGTPQFGVPACPLP